MTPPSGPVPSQLEDEVVRCDVHLLSEVESVRAEPLHARVEMNLVAAGLQNSFYIVLEGIGGQAEDRDVSATG